MSVRKRQWHTRSGVLKEAWVVNYTHNGKRRLKTFSKKKDADNFASTANVEIREGLHVPDRESVTVEEAAELWLSSGSNLERTTIDQRKQHLHYHILPFLGRCRLPEITVPLIRQFADKLAETPYPDDFPRTHLRGKPRSHAMVKRVLVSLGSILGDAQERGLVSHNAVHELKRRKRTRSADKRHKRRLEVGVDIPTNDEVRRIVETASGRYRPFIVTAIFTGLRASELRGLRWKDVNLSAGRLEVKQRADRFNTEGLPKSSSGRRTVPLPPIVVNTLKEWKLRCPRQGATADKPGDLHLVFPNEKGNVEWHGNIINRGLMPTMIAAGVAVDSGKKDKNGKPILLPKYTGLHAFRHWYASWCLNRVADGGQELPPKLVQDRMGHSSITVTLDVYGHLFKSDDDSETLAAAEKSLLSAV